MTEPTITREDAGQRGGRYVARIDGQEAELVFSRQGDTVTADHTGVPDAAPDHRLLVLAHGNGHHLPQSVRGKNFWCPTGCWSWR